MKLTTKTIEALQPSDRRQEIKDDGCRGLYLLVAAGVTRSLLQAPELFDALLQRR